MKSVQFGDSTFQPSKILCVGRNFAAHVKELGNEAPDEMVVFMKPNSAIASDLYANIGPEQLHYETELCFTVIEGELAGVGVGLDLTKRALQSRLKEKGLPWERAKAFDGAVIFSDFVPLDDDIESLSIRLEVDGELRQTGGVELMMYKPADILKELKSSFSLEDGDIIMTGTPAGVGEVKTGEMFSAAALAGAITLVQSSWIAQ
jgi:2-keto-4-pentenoate hydratase/2-oxohepta-3-ene-1,7-dioic acid hydratase in catechol pathway